LVDTFEALDLSSPAGPGLGQGQGAGCATICKTVSKKECKIIFCNEIISDIRQAISVYSILTHTTQPLRLIFHVNGDFGKTGLAIFRYLTDNIIFKQCVIQNLNSYNFK